MRLKLLSVFLAIQVVSFGLWYVFLGDQPLQVTAKAEVVEVETRLPQALELSSAAIFEADEIQALKEVTNHSTKQEIVPISTPTLPHFSARNQNNQELELLQPIHENQIERALAKLPSAHVETVKNITLDYSPEAHRGLGGGSLIILRAINMTSEEFVGVLIHEVAHNVDYGFLVPQQETRPSEFNDAGQTLYESDPSVDFYRLSWTSNTQHHAESSHVDFVSGYAMSDPFEDFAESYIYYVLHQKDFKTLATRSAVLQAKYDFMREVVFKNQTFDMADGEIEMDQEIWDTTVLPYDLGEFMG